MLVRQLDFPTYNEGGNYHVENIKDPTWELIEKRIRALNKEQFPYVWLWVGDARNKSPDFHIIGGAGDYWMAGNVEGAEDRRYFNPEGDPEKEIAVWTSDQGFSDLDLHVCHDLDTVLRAALYFCEFGKFDPGISWEE